MKRKFLKTLACLAAFGTMLSTLGTASAETVFVYENQEITIHGDLCCSKAKQIADSIAGQVTIDGEPITPSNILCLFGHSLAQATGNRINHNVRPNSPRCDRITFRVDYCTRLGCNYSVETIISQVAIVCC